MMLKKVDTILFLLLMIILVPLELLCAALAYHTLGEITSVIYFLIVSLNIVCIALAFYSRLAAGFLAVLLGLAIIPYQLLLGHRFLQLQHEAARIVAYVYEHKVQTGEYPADLTGYEFQDATLQAYIQKYSQDEKSGGFVLYYRVGTESTSHSYSPQHGWGYYPD
jgi:hypothetical protein